ncbi:hypothetical protein T01_8538 [Trichinella spiralis]|uniref:Uncharacterized protein n=1 Tax=Trichinella spiralis TaxID=6334 RepID=A0A0V1AZ05_TRISP|nr:hypothetical protein T01_8538 [Trichinella spiralis]
MKTIPKGYHFFRVQFNNSLKAANLFAMTLEPHDDERRNHLIYSNVQISKKLQKAYLSSILMAESFVKPKLIKQPFI